MDTVPDRRESPSWREGLQELVESWQDPTGPHPSDDFGTTKTHPTKPGEEIVKGALAGAKGEACPRG